MVLEIFQTVLEPETLAVSLISGYIFLLLIRNFYDAKKWIREIDILILSFFVGGIFYFFILSFFLPFVTWGNLDPELGLKISYFLTLIFTVLSSFEVFRNPKRYYRVLNWPKISRSNAIEDFWADKKIQILFWTHLTALVIVIFPFNETERLLAAAAAIYTIHIPAYLLSHRFLIKTCFKITEKPEFEENG